MFDRIAKQLLKTDGEFTLEKWMYADRNNPHYGTTVIQTKHGYVAGVTGFDREHQLVSFTEELGDAKWFPSEKAACIWMDKHCDKGQGLSREDCCIRVD